MGKILIDHNVFGKCAIKWWGGKKFNVRTEVVLPGDAHLAIPARNSGFNCYTLSESVINDIRTESHNDTGSFVAQHNVIFHNIGPDAAFREVMNV